MKLNQTVFVCVYDKTTKQVLLVLNKDKELTGKPGKWGLPGGGIEEKDYQIDQNGLDQTTINAVYRELKEETGLTKEFIKIQSQISRDAVLLEHVLDRSNKNKFHQVIVFYAETLIPATKLKVTPDQTTDVSKTEWMLVSKLYDLLKQKKLYYSHYRRIEFFLKKFGKK